MAQKIIDLDAARPIQSSVAELQLPARALIVLLSDFDGKFNDQVRSMFSRVIAPAALNPGALILDDAKPSGAARLMAEAALAQDKMVTLLGVVPNDRPVSEIDTDHTWVLRLPAEWSDVPKYTFQIADELIKDGGASRKPAVAVLLGGSEAEKKALVRCARRGWPVLVAQGTGGLADEILTAQSTVGDAGTTSLKDPDLKEVMETASLYAWPISASADDLSRILLGRIDERRDAVDGTLKQAWLRFDELDLTAVAKQARFRVVEGVLITLAVLAALFAILTTGSAIPAGARAWAHAHGLPGGTLHLLVLLTPIALSVTAAYNSHFRDGTKWILLRGAAEALKREIFRFRAKAGAYSDEQCRETSRELKLAATIKEITSALEQSEVNKTNLLSRERSDQERMTLLSPGDYIEKRLRDQVRFFEGKTGNLARELRLWQFFIYAAGAAGTFLAAIRLDVWVALATALVTALTTKLQTDQVENSLMQYNQALASLRNIEAWWNALSKWEQGRRQNIDVLVDQTERTLESEMAGWVQHMQLGLDKLTEKEPQK